MKKERMSNRRSFLGTLATGFAVAFVGKKTPFGVQKTPGGQFVRRMQTRTLGKTGYQVGVFSIGGQAALEDPNGHDKSIEIINRAIDLGVNYIDTAQIYGRGSSERFIGEVMETRRNEVFLATKTDDRSYDGSMRQLELSLKRLQTDHLDLWQVHNIQTNNDVDFILSREGAIRAYERAHNEGIVRFVGVTGHKDPFVLRRAIESYPFDAILMALNAADRHDRSFVEHLLPVAVEKNMGVMAMKVPSRGKIFSQGGVKTMKQAMGYVLTLPVSTAVIGISEIAELEENVRIAADFQPLTEEEMLALERSTNSYYADALWYRDHM